MLEEPLANTKSKMKCEADFNFSKMSPLVGKVNELK